MLNAAAQLHLKILLIAPTCFAFCHRAAEAQGRQTLQSPPAGQAPTPEGTPVNADPTWGVSAHPEQQAGYPFHQQVPRRSWPTNGGRK